MTKDIDDFLDELLNEDTDSGTDETVTEKKATQAPLPEGYKTLDTINRELEEAFPKALDNVENTPESYRQAYLDTLATRPSMSEAGQLREKHLKKKRAEIEEKRLANARQTVQRGGRVKTKRKPKAPSKAKRIWSNPTPSNHIDYPEKRQRQNQADSSVTNSVASSNNTASDKGRLSDHVVNTLTIKHPTGKSLPEGTRGAGLGLTPGETWKGKRNTEREVKALAYPGQDKKASEKQLNYYLDYTVTLKDYRATDQLLKDLLPPKGRAESPEERLKREKAQERIITGGSNLYRRGSTSFDKKDQTILEFLAAFKYSKPQHIAQLLQVSDGTARGRLHKLEGYGLVKKQNYQAVQIWHLTPSGMTLAGHHSRKNWRPGDFNPSMFAHTFVTQHLATTLWNNTEDLLLEEDNYPYYGRTNSKGEPIPGDTLVSEPLMRSSLQRHLGFNKERTHPLTIPDLREIAQKEFRDFQEAGGSQAGLTPPQFQEGNEYLWIPLPQKKGIDISYHVPDLVVARPDRDGKPQSLMIEAERKSASDLSYRNTMLAFMEHLHVYRQLIWVCLPGSGYRAIEDEAEKLGLIDSGLVRIIPLIKNQQVYRGSIWDI